MWDGFNAVILQPLGGRACWICRGVIIYSFNILKKWQLHCLLEIKALNSRPRELSGGYQAVFAVFSLNFFWTTWGTCSPFVKYWLFPADGTCCFLCWPLKTPWTEHVRNEGNEELCMIKINCKIFIPVPEEWRRGDEPKSTSSSQEMTNVSLQRHRWVGNLWFVKNIYIAKTEGKLDSGKSHRWIFPWRLFPGEIGDRPKACGLAHIFWTLFTHLLPLFVTSPPTKAASIFKLSLLLLALTPLHAFRWREAVWLGFVPLYHLEVWTFLGFSFLVSEMETVISTSVWELNMYKRHHTLKSVWVLEVKQTQFAFWFCLSAVWFRASYFPFCSPVSHMYCWDYAWVMEWL